MKKTNHDKQGRPVDALRSNRDRRNLLERVLDTPHIAQIVPELRPEMLHRVIQTIGLEDCGELMALATPQQLMGIFDLDLWRGDPGFDEKLDAGRFGIWLDVLMEAGPQIAAQKLAGLKVDLVVAAMAQHIAVFDRSAVGPFTTTDGMEITPRRKHKSNVSWEVGSYLIEGRQTDWWDTIIDLLMFLHEKHHDFFNRVMRGCRTLSNGAREIDGLDDLLTDREQDLFNLALGREQRRGKKGYVPPAEAQAFLQMSRQFKTPGDAHASPNPIARACFQAIEPLPAESAANEPETRVDRVAAFVDMLVGAGVVSAQPRALLNASPDDVGNRSVLETQLQQLYELDSAAYATRTEEFAFLANTLIAGCSLQGRPFTPREASDAAAAICNLGLESWPGLEPQFLSNHDLVSTFQMGWSVLYRDVCMHTAESLLRTLAGLRCRDRQIQAEINGLRIKLAKHLRDGRPWYAREALDILISLDTPAWAALLGLIAECPVMHAAIDASLESQKHAISPSAFAFIGHKTQVMQINKFLRMLPARLTG